MKYDELKKKAQDVGRKLVSLPFVQKLYLQARKFPRRTAIASFFVLLLVVSLVLYAGRAHADSQGPLSASASSNCVDDVSTGTVTWTSPGNAFSTNTTYATASVDGTTTHYIKCTSFGFTIPTGSTINGIVVGVTRKSSGTGNGGSNDAAMRVIKGGVIGTTDRSTATTYTTTDSSENHGSSSDLWGTTWTVSDINASNFGAAFAATKASAAGAAQTVSVDVIQITVYYTPPPAAYNQASYRLFNNKDATSVSTFGAKADYTAGFQASSITSADFNGDGKQDLAIPSRTDGAVGVLINNGNGTFAAKVNYATGTTAYGAAAADFNGDGKPDLAVSNWASNTVSVLINNGDGTFATKVDYSTGTNPQIVTAADFNGDGKPDLAVVNDGAGTVSVLMNNGSGTFATKVDYTVGGSLPYSVTAADFNADGKPDLAVANGSTSSVSVLMNNGNGTFAAKVDYTTGTTVYSVAAADFNADGKPDMAVVSNGGNVVSIFINNGNGTFAAKVDYATGIGPQSVATADFNGDSKSDLLVANNGADTVSVLMNNGNGTFAAKVDYATGSNPISAIGTDLNGDGNPDIAVANFLGTSTSILLEVSTPPMDVNAPLAALNTAATSTGDGQPFRLRMDVGISTSAVNANQASLKLQYATQSGGSCSATPTGNYADITDSSTVRYYKNVYGSNGSNFTDTNAYGPTDGVKTVVLETYQERGTTTFTNPTAIPAGQDGMWDFALTTYHTFGGVHYCMRIVQSSGTALDTYTTYPEIITPPTSYNQAAYRWYASSNQNGLAAFAANVDYATSTSPQGIATADFNSDGKPDMAVVAAAGPSVSVFMNNGNGTFAAKVDYTTGTNPQPVVAADFNGDGKPDLAVGNNNASTVSVLMNNGNGTFAAKVDYAVSNFPTAIAAADFNGDGKADLVTANGSNSNTVSVLMNNGNGTFAAKVDYTPGTAPGDVTAADFNGDGKPDLAVSNSSSGTVSVFMNNGNGTFAAKVDYTTGASPSHVVTADFNGDGKPDLATLNINSNSISVFLNNGDGTFAPKADYSTANSPRSMATADFNGDGKPDLATIGFGATVISVHLNNGSGTFGPKNDFTAGSSTQSITAADFNGDGKPDLAAVHNSAGTVSVLLNSSVSYGVALAGNSKLIDANALNKPFRLRLSLATLGSGLAASGQSFKLQYAIKSSTCAASSYADVTTSTPIQWYDNTNITGGGAIGATTSDPADGTTANVAQTYQEANNFSNSNSVVYAGEDGLWDFSLSLASGQRGGADICLRVIAATGTPTINYGAYPEIQYGPQLTQRMHGGKWFDQLGIRQPYFTGN